MEKEKKRENEKEQMEIEYVCYSLWSRKKQFDLTYIRNLTDRDRKMREEKRERECEWCDV